jgi:hypothetical protein
MWFFCGAFGVRSTEANGRKLYDPLKVMHGDATDATYFLWNLGAK